MNKLGIYMTATGALALAMACGDDDDNGGGTPTANTLNFLIDDSVNMTHDASDNLAWKGDFSIDENGFLDLTKTWDDPNPRLFDDGPWNEGGHEPAGSTAGDSIWGVALFYADGTEDTRGYGAIRNGADIGNEIATGDGEWIWIGGNGEFTITAGETSVDAAPLTIPPHGNTDLRLTVDLAAAQQTFDRFNGCTGVEVKGGAWSWSNPADMSATGDDWVFVLSEIAGTPEYKHIGLLVSGSEPEFIFNMLDCPTAGGGVATLEYKDDSGAAVLDGVTAEISTDGGTTWTVQNIQLKDPTEFGQNSFVLIP